MTSLLLPTHCQEARLLGSSEMVQQRYFATYKVRNIHKINKLSMTNRIVTP